MEQSSTIKNEDDIETIENNEEKTDVDIQENGYATIFVLFDLPLFLVTCAEFMLHTFAFFVWKFLATVQVCTEI